MNYYLLIPLVVIIISALPIKLEGRGSFNLLEMSGAFGVFLYKFKIEHQRFKISKRKIIWLAENEEKEVEFSQTQMIFTKMLIGQIKDKTRLKELFVMYNFGLEDSFLTAMIAGHINVFLYGLLVSIKNYKPTASVGVCDNLAFNKQVCQFALTMKISISLFDIVYSLLRSVILTKKEERKLKKEQNEGAL